MKYICSFPKCGRTWLRYTLAQYCQLLYNTDVPIGFKYLGKVFIDHGGPKREHIYDKFPLVKFAHDHPFDEVVGRKRIILVRNFLDTMVSYHHHLEFSNPDQPSLIQNITDNLMLRWVDYMKAWIGTSGITQWIRYEDLKLVSTWEIMLKFLEIASEPDKIRKAMERSTFDKMLAEEKVNPINKSTHQNHRRVRKGKVEGWKDEIPLARGKQLMDAVKSKLSAQQIRVLEPHGVFKL